MWQQAMAAEALKIGQGRCWSHPKGQIGLYRTSKGLFAIDNACPHYEAQLHQGELSEDAVRCPWHRWRFSLIDGRCDTGATFNIKTYPVKEEAGMLWVDVDRGQLANT